MPRSALPPHLQDIEANFADDKQFGYGFFGRIYTWINQKTKTWFAFSYRCTERWARWRKTPRILAAYFGKGSSRFESADGDDTTATTGLWWWKHDTTIYDYYASRIQYYCRWHIMIQWPLMLSFHWYPKKKDTPYPGKMRPNLDGKVICGYWGHFDAGLIYWMVTSMYVGRNWK